MSGEGSAGNNPVVADSTAACASVFLLDVDDTLLDNDRFADDLGARLRRDFGDAARDDYFAVFESERKRLGYADYLGALQLFRVGREDDPALLAMSAFLLDYPFAERVYPRAFEAIAHLRTLGRTAVLSDGDVVFQPHKIARSGLWQALDGEVMICMHKEKSLDAVQRRFPAAHYVMVDDKPTLLAAMKRVLGARLTTVFVRQGHYARAAAGANFDPPPDVSIAAIADLVGFTLDTIAPPRPQGDASAARSVP